MNTLFDFCKHLPVYSTLWFNFVLEARTFSQVNTVIELTTLSFRAKRKLNVTPFTPFLVLRTKTTLRTSQKQTSTLLFNSHVPQYFKYKLKQTKTTLFQQSSTTPFSFHLGSTLLHITPYQYAIFERKLISR